MMKTDHSKNTTKTVWLFSLEPIETRYTKHWYTYLKEKFQNDLGDEYNINQIDGYTEYASSATPGAFLNFGDTQGWKSSQLLKFIDLIRWQRIGDDDIIFFTDFWNPAILQVKYMKDLMDKNWKIIALAHAGSYDPSDFLGRKVQDKAWSYAAETAMAEACDRLVFATAFHVELFKKSISINPDKIMISGFPLEYTQDIFKYLRIREDRLDAMIFPHRNAPEKQPELFDAVMDKYVKDYMFFNPMKAGVNKLQYHDILSSCKVAVSFATQETLGIAMYEAMECNVIPLVPNRLSYYEMYDNLFKYNDMDEFYQKLEIFMTNYDTIVNGIEFKLNLKKLRSQYFSMDVKSVINI